MKLIFLGKLRSYLLVGAIVSSAAFAKGETQTVICEVGPDAEECQVCISVPANQRWYFGYRACPDWVKYIRIVSSSGNEREISPSTAAAYSGSAGVEVTMKIGLKQNLGEEREWTYPITCEGNVVANVRVVQEAMQKLSDGVYTRKIDGLEWTFTIRNGVASAGYEGCAATAIPDGTSGAVSIPKEFGGCPVKSIAEFAFCDCKKLDKIVIPAGVTNIGMCAFRGCSMLTSVNIPSSVINIDTEAFSDCASLGTGVVIVDGCVLCVNGNCPERVELPLGTRLIGGSAFSGRNKLLVIGLPDGLTHVGNDAFDNCGFETVCLPESLECIGDMAFANSFLKEVRLPAGLRHIGNGAFTCTRIATIEIPSSVAFIGDGAFVPSNSKCGIYVKVDPENVNYVSKDGALFDKGLTTVFSWPEDKKIEVAHGVRRIAPSVFSGNTASVGDAVTIPASVTNIGRYAFSGCRLAEISFAEGLETISYNAFDYNDFTAVAFPSTLREIGGGIFNGCNHLVSVFYRGDAPKCLSPYNGTASNLTSYVRVGTTGWGSSGDVLPDMWPRQEKYGGIVQRQIRAWTSYPVAGYVVSFDSNGGSGIMDGQAFQIGRDQSLSFNRFERAGWMFVGWALAPEGPVIYADGEAARSLPFGDDLKLALYAIWGDAETGFVVKPSEGKTVVEVTIPQGVDAAKVTVEVSPKVESVKPNGAKVKVVSGSADITEFLNVPVADESGVVDLTKAAVKEEIVKEAMDVEKGAKIELDVANPSLTTPNTRVGLFYQLREGATLEGMVDGDSTIGDGKPWTPEIKVKGGTSAFYAIGVGTKRE